MKKWVLGQKEGPVHGSTRRGVSGFGGEPNSGPGGARSSHAAAVWKCFSNHTLFITKQFLLFFFGTVSLGLLISGERREASRPLPG